MRIPFSFPGPTAVPFDVVGLGLNSIDVLAVVEKHPQPNSKQKLRQVRQLPGGQIATAMTVCARLGWKARYIGRFGDDEHGRLSRESLVHEHIDLEGSRTIPGTTNQFAVVLVDEQSGERTVLWHRDDALTIRADEVSRVDVCAGRILVVDCFETAAATEAARYARDAGMLTIVDVEKVRPGVHHLLEHIDAIIAAEQFPTELTGYTDLGRALEAMAHEFGAPLVCVTLGADGSLALCGGREIRTPGFPVTPVDTTGAGDAFRGGFAAACLRSPGGDIADVLTYANAVAALNCRAPGARGGIPTAGEIDDLIATRHAQ